ncbi:MAG: hypothetical protein ACFBSC_17915 [Microcoleaceae cyanobacterium]
MSKIWILLGWLVLGCALSTFVAFLASLHPDLKLWAMFLWGVFIVFQAVGWLADDAIASFLRIDVKAWWGVLFLSLVCAVVGLCLWLFS